MTGIKWIPVNLIQWVLKNRMVSTFKIYILLNSSSDGYVRGGSELTRQLVSWTGWTTKTVNKHVNKLIEIGWLGSSDGVVYVRSMHWINHVLLGSDHRREVEFNFIWMEKWKGYLGAAFIGNLSFDQQMKSIAETLSSSECEKGRSYQRVRVSAFFPVSGKGIQKILGFNSKSTASNLKKEAILSGLIKRKHDFEVIAADLRAFDFVRKHWFPGVLRRKGQLVIQRTDLIAPQLRYKSRKKSNHIRRGSKGKQIPIKSKESTLR